jgi:metallo-beta-lactamase class B
MRVGISTIEAKRIAVCVLALAGWLAGGAAIGQEADSSLGRIARAAAKSQIETAFRLMNRPFEPCRVIGNIYYVGASDVSSFLIVTPRGHILIDSGFGTTVPLIREAVRKLGFRFEDIKILLNSHAHVDHAGGHAVLKRLCGAQIVMSEADAATLARGGRGDFLPFDDEVIAYEPVKADRIIRDGEEVTRGGVTLTAHLTPGHTRGCTTWTMAVEEGGKRFDVVFYGGTTILPGVRLVNNPKYPAIADDFEKTFRRLKSLPCDVFLAPHGSMFGLREKAQRRAAGQTPNPFIDPEGYRGYISQSEGAFRRKLALQQRAATAGESADRGAR